MIIVKKKILAAVFIGIVTQLYTQSDNILINEFMLSNSVTLVDEDFDYPDWIEIYNPNTTPVNLEGFGLSDDPDMPFKWVFPSITISPKGFILVYASGKNRASDEALHTNFRLNNDGEHILLTAPNSEIVDQIEPVSLSKDIAYGRAMDGSKQLEVLSVSSPNASNVSVSGITFSHHSGFYTEPITFMMSANNDHDIYYTTDGSDPSVNSTLFNGSIELGYLKNHPDILANISTSPNWIAPTNDQFNAHVIKAATFNSGERSSRIYHRTFLIDESIGSKFNDFHLVSIVTDQNNLFDQNTGIYVPGIHFDPSNSVWTGNYFQKGIEWERTGHFQYFDPKGNLLVEQKVGLRIHGGKGRNYPQKSLRIYARSEYRSPKINYAFFEDDEKRIFDRLVLKNSMSCWNKTIFKDEATAKICEDLNFETLDSKPVIVFINGEYWGIQTIREYFDHNYISEKYNVDKDSVNIVLHMSGNQPTLPTDWGTVEGSNQGHIELYKFLNHHDLTLDANYERVRQFLDIESIIDYYCAEIYFNNKDWPRYNNKLWNIGSNGLWKQVLFDIDGGWGYLGNSYNILSCISDTIGCSVQTQKDGTFLFRKLIESQEFKEQFVKRMVCLMENDFEANRVNETVEDLKNQYTEGVKDHINRWHYPSSISSWENSISSKLINFANNRKEHIIDHMKEEFNIAFDFPDLDCENILSNIPKISSHSDYELINVVPNPSFTNYITLKYEFDVKEVKYEIYSSKGQFLATGIVQKGQKIFINYESGIYFLRTVFKDKVFINKIILSN